LKILDVSNGEVRSGLEMNLQASGGFILPDDARIAFTKSVTGQVTHGLFIARLDGTERSLLVQLDH
jgi:hypothetical protein